VLRVLDHLDLVAVQIEEYRQQSTPRPPLRLQFEYDLLVHQLAMELEDAVGLQHNAARSSGLSRIVCVRNIKGDLAGRFVWSDLGPVVLRGFELQLEPQCQCIEIYCRSHIRNGNGG
jgi:hypothetical protein